MKRLVLVDTGPLYALADPSDQYHLRAQTELDRMNAAKEFAGIAYPTLAEAYTLVLRRLGIAYAHQWVGQLMDGSVLINPEPGDYVRAATLMLNFKNQSITLFDAVVATVSQRLRSALWTYDRDFELLGIKRWASLTPARVRPAHPAQAASPNPGISSKGFPSGRSRPRRRT